MEWQIEKDLRVLLDFADTTYFLWDGNFVRWYEFANVPGLSFQRNSEATAWTSGPSPLLTNFAVDEARLETIDPVTTESIGIVLEPKSKRLTNHFATPFSKWTENNAPGKTRLSETYFGVFSDGLTITSNNSPHNSFYLPSDFTLIAGTAYGCQFYYVAGTSPSVEINIRRVSDGFPAGLFGPPGALEEASQQLAGVITNLTQDVIEDPQNGPVHRVRYTFTPNSTETHRAEVGPNSSAANDSVTFLGGGIETNPFPTSPILHNPDNTDVSREADELVITGLENLTPNQAFLSGGPVTVRADFDYANTSGAEQYLFALDSGTLNDMHRLAIAPANQADIWTNNLEAQTVGGGITRSSRQGAIVTGRNRAVYVADTNNFRLYVNGARHYPSNGGSLPVPAMTKIVIGSDGSGSSRFSGSIRSMAVYAGAKSTAQDESWGRAYSQEPGKGALVAGVSFAPFSLSMYSVPDINLGSPSFDSAGNAYLRYDDKLVKIEGTEIETYDFGRAASIAINRDIMSNNWDDRWNRSFSVDNSIHIDDSDPPRLYTLVIPRHSNMQNAALLWSDDKAKNWKAVALNAFWATMEKIDTNNDLSGVPTVISYEYGEDENETPILSNLYLERIVDAGAGAVTVGSKIVVSNESLLVPNHSGAGNSTYTTAEKIFVTYPTTDDSATGTEVKIKQFQKASGSEDAEVTLGRSSTTPKIADNHDIPAVTIDSTGKLHVVFGAHQEMFKYRRSNNAFDISGGWSSEVELGEPEIGVAPNTTWGSNTYVSLNITPEDQLIVLSRNEGDTYRFAIAQIILPADWTQVSEVTWNGVKHRLIARPDRNFYGAWRQRVTQDRQGNLYLNIRWWPNDLTAEEAAELGLYTEPGNDESERFWFNTEVPYIQPTTFISADGGLTWQSQNPSV